MNSDCQPKQELEFLGFAPQGESGSDQSVSARSLARFCQQPSLRFTRHRSITGVCRCQGLLQAKEGEVCPAEDTYHSSCLCQQDGWNQVSPAVSVSERAVAVVPVRGHQAEGIERSFRLDSGCRAIPDDRRQVGAITSRSFCNKVLSSSPQFLKLETRSFGRGHGCLRTGLEYQFGLRKPPLVSNCQSASKSTSDHCTTMVIPSMVSTMQPIARSQASRQNFRGSYQAYPCILADANYKGANPFNSHLRLPSHRIW